MEKKFYEAPELEMLDMHVEGFFCGSGGDGYPGGGTDFDDSDEL